MKKREEGYTRRKRGVRCTEAEILLGTLEYIFMANEEYNKVDREYDRIILSRKEGHLYAELVRGNSHFIVYDVDDTGYNGGTLNRKKDEKEGRNIFTFL